MTEKQTIYDHQFENGLVLVAQPMPWLESAAFSINVPAGCRYDHADKIGISNFVCEMVQRGAGEFDSRGYIEALDLLGVDYSSSSSVYGTHFGGAMCAGQLDGALEIFADVLQRPHFPVEQLEDGRAVCYQEIAAIEDDLVQRAMSELRLRYFGQPDGRSCFGTKESVGSIGMSDLTSFFESNYRPNGTIIAVAGRIEWNQLRDRVGEMFSDWNQGVASEVVHEPAKRGVHHIPFESQQTHITLAYPAVPYSHDDYYTSRGAVGVLSDGMSSRLFTEIREKRGLCYSVSASVSSILDRGGVFCYSGTTTERAQETLDVLVEELVALKQGITDNELRRLKVQIRSSLIMQQESCRARAGSIAGDWFHLGHVRSLDEVNKRINDLTVDSVNQYLTENPPTNFDVVTLGAQPLELNTDEVSPTSIG